MLSRTPVAFEVRVELLAFEDIAMVIDLAELVFSLRAVARLHVEILHDHPGARADPEGVFIHRFENRHDSV